MKGKYNTLFALIASINKAGGRLTYKGVVSDFTNKRTESPKDLSPAELQQLEANLKALAPKSNIIKPTFDPKLDKTRKAIISQFRSIGRDTNAAKAWAEKYGVAGVKKKFNDYTGQELHKLLTNAKKIKIQYIDNQVKGI